jgi:undecaprenyl-diphosphatase
MMEWWHGLILGLVQGIAEFLPISSSGHLTIMQETMGISGEGNLAFDIAVHVATVLSTLVVFWKPISRIGKGCLTKGMNKEKDYVLKILVSMIPILFVGFLLKDIVERIFDTERVARHTGNGLLVVGIMLIVTAILLLVCEIISAVRDLKHGKDAEDKAQKIADRMSVTSEMGGPERRKIYALQNGINYWQAFIVGVAQAFAVLPGLSRSGATIATGLMSKVKKTSIAQFAFLMVIVPILGEAFLEIIKGVRGADMGNFLSVPVLCGFVAAFIAGLFACTTMVQILKKFRLWGFAVYCFIVGVLCIVLPYCIG